MKIPTRLHELTEHLSDAEFRAYVNLKGYADDQLFSTGCEEIHVPKSRLHLIAPNKRRSLPIAERHFLQMCKSMGLEAVEQGAKWVVRGLFEDIWGVEVGAKSGFPPSSSLVRENSPNDSSSLEPLREREVQRREDSLSSPSAPLALTTWKDVNEARRAYLPKARDLACSKARKARIVGLEKEFGPTAPADALHGYMAYHLAGSSEGWDFEKHFVPETVWRPANVAKYLDADRAAQDAGQSRPYTVSKSQASQPREHPATVEARERRDAEMAAAQVDADAWNAMTPEEQQALKDSTVDSLPDSPFKRERERRFARKDGVRPVEQR